MSYLSLFAEKKHEQNVYLRVLAEKKHFWQTNISKYTLPQHTVQFFEQKVTYILVWGLCIT